MERIGVAIAGASCSGKTTLANAVASECGGVVLRLDDYYFPFHGLTFEQREAINFDHPNAVDWVRLVGDVASLLSGKAIDAPVYDFTQHTRSRETRPIAPVDVLVIEGLFALSKPLADLCQLRVFVEADEMLCLRRRMQRDILERGRSAEEVMHRFSNQVSPMFREHVLPTKPAANLVVSGDAHLSQGLGSVLASIAANDLEQLLATVG